MDDDSLWSSAILTKLRPTIYYLSHLIHWIAPFMLITMVQIPDGHGLSIEVLCLALKEGGDRDCLL